PSDPPPPPDPPPASVVPPPSDPPPVPASGEVGPTRLTVPASRTVSTGTNAHRSDHDAPAAAILIRTPPPEGRMPAKFGPRAQPEFPSEAARGADERRPPLCTTTRKL